MQTDARYSIVRNTLRTSKAQAKCLVAITVGVFQEAPKQSLETKKPLKRPDQL